MNADPRDQPAAPQPEWEWRAPPANQFNRERFLLRIVAAIIGVQFGLYVLAGIMCSYMSVVVINKVLAKGSYQLPAICPNVQENIRQSVADGLAVLLALLGGGAVAMGEYQRRHPAQRPQARLPEPEPWDAPPPPPRPLPPVVPAVDPRAAAPLDPRDPRNRPPEDGPPLVGHRQGR